MAAPMGYSRQRSVDQSYHLMHRGVDREEIQPRHLSSHPGTNQAWLLSQLYLKRIGVYQSAECPTCPESDEDVEHALFVCLRLREERERFSYGKAPTPESIGRCLLFTERMGCCD